MVAVYINVGAGRFCELKRVVDDNAVGVRTVVVADLDGDGTPDLASASKDDNTVAWYPNDGAANFGRKIVITAEAYGAYSLVARDIEGDGDYDLIVASNGDDTVALWRNDGSANFVKTVIFAYADFVLSVTAFDFDRDGDLDVASASYFDGYVRWYENLDGAGNTWANHTLYVGAQVRMHARARRGARVRGRYVAADVPLLMRRRGTTSPPRTSTTTATRTSSR